MSSLSSSFSERRSVIAALIGTEIQYSDIYPSYEEYFLINKASLITIKRSLPMKSFCRRTQLLNISAVNKMVEGQKKKNPSRWGTLVTAVRL